MATKNTALKLGDNVKYFDVELEGETYHIPLADYMPMRDAKAMMQIKRMAAKERDGAYTEFFFAYFERYLGEAFDSMSSKDFELLMDAWNTASDAESSATTGE